MKNLTKMIITDNGLVPDEQMKVEAYVKNGDTMLVPSGSGLGYHLVKWRGKIYTTEIF